MDNQTFSSTSILKLWQAGMHLGHKTSGWNPKMRPFIHSERSGSHVIDLQQTQQGLRLAYNLLRTAAAQGKRIVFVGTKSQASEIIEEEARRCDVFFVHRRWLAGMLTNFDTIKGRLNHLRILHSLRDSGDLFRCPKKVQCALNRELFKLESSLGGLKHMYAKPEVVFVIDQKVESIAINEAVCSGITIIGMVDTDGNPDGIDIVIPANDDSANCIRLITRLMANAVLEGKADAGNCDPDANPNGSNGSGDGPDPFAVGVRKSPGPAGFDATLALSLPEKDTQGNDREYV